MPNNPLSKNIISSDLATNDLEKLVANMTGSNIPEEQTSGLGKELKKIFPGAGGLLPAYDSDEIGQVLSVEEIPIEVALFNCTIPNKDIELSNKHGSDTYIGTYSGFKLPTRGNITAYNIYVAASRLPVPCQFFSNHGDYYIQYQAPLYDLTYRFYGNGTYVIIYEGELDYYIVSPKRMRMEAGVLTPTAIWRDESELPIPSPTDAGKALLVNNQGTAYVLGNWPNELPTPTAEDESKFIRVNENGDYELLDGQVPTSTVEDSGKLLGVDSSGAYILRNNYTPDPQTVTIGLVEHEATVHNILVGTAELEDGVSDLPTGVIYLQIEE